MSPDIHDPDATQPSAAAFEEENDPRIGTVLEGKYRIERIIGQGGLGRVYEATQLALNAPVAVKFMLAEGAAHPKVRARFKREAAALSRLRHPGIVAAHDYGDSEGDLFIVMEFVRGVSLADEILIDGLTMPYSRIVGILGQILQVIEAAHREGIVHRDLKPENVMLLDAGDRTDHVKVLDFGIALMDDREGAERLTSTNQVQGTPLYMSPEQCRGRDVGPPTDVYAVGAILYEMLAGDTPFSGQSVVDVMAAHMFVIPPPIAERGVFRHVPPELERLATWALSKKPEDRPTATEFRDALDDMLKGSGATQLAARSTEERIRALALTRNERGLPQPDMGTSPTVLHPIPTIKPGESGPLVLLWGFDQERGSDLASALGVNGVGARVWAHDEMPEATIAGIDVRALVIAGDQAEARATRLRAHSKTARLPILVADLADATDTPALVRAGASDVALAAVGDDVLCKKLWRLIRRGR